MVKKIFDKLTMFITCICGFVIAGIVLVIISNIVMRAFGKPIKGSTEMVQYLTMTMAVLMLCRTCFDDKHIYVSVFTDHMPRVPRLIIYGIGRLISSAIIAIMAYKCVQSMANNLTRTTEILKIPYNLLLTVMTIGLALAAVMFFVQGLLYFATIKNPEDDPSSETVNGFRDDDM